MKLFKWFGNFSLQICGEEVLDVEFGKNHQNLEILTARRHHQKSPFLFYFVLSFFFYKSLLSCHMHDIVGGDNRSSEIYVSLRTKKHEFIGPSSVFLSIILNFVAHFWVRNFSDDNWWWKSKLFPPHNFFSSFVSSFVHFSFHGDMFMCHKWNIILGQLCFLLQGINNIFGGFFITLCVYVDYNFSSIINLRENLWIVIWKSIKKFTNYFFKCIIRL